MSRKRKHKTKLPKDNGRPQLWMRDTYQMNSVPYFERLRIIYPDGGAEYSSGGVESGWFEPCWLGYFVSLEASVKKMLEFDKENDFKTIFLGYL